MKLVLFDIDGTLLKSSPLGSKAFLNAIRKTLPDLEINKEVSFAGATDLGILYHLLSDTMREDEIIEYSKIFFPVYESYLQEIYVRGEDTGVLPGVEKLLECLHQRSDIKVGLLTGNSNGGARIKLDPFSLNSYFEGCPSAFGCERRFREDLPELVFERLKMGNTRLAEFTPERTVIIGDTIHDINCAKPMNIRVIAVASGGTGYKTLSGLAPWRVYHELLDTNQILEDIFSIQ